MDRALRTTRYGFTLIEMVVVVAVLAILSAMVASGGNLSDDFDLAILLMQPEEGGGPEGPYFKKKKSEELLDPWESPYIIRFPGTVNYDFDIVSAGPDRRVGTDDDITN